MRKSSGEGNPGEDLLGAFLTFKNGLTISGMSVSSYGEALGAGQACGGGVQGVQPPEGRRHTWPGVPGPFPAKYLMLPR